MSSTKAQIHRPPNSLLDKIGGPLPKSNPTALARAEANIEKLSDEFANWLETDLNRLNSAENDWINCGDKNALNNMHTAAIDLKGLAQTYGFPLVSRLAGSLAYLTSPEREEHRDYNIVRAHTNAIRAAVRDGITDADHQTGVALAEELERKTRQKPPPNK